VKHFSRFLIFAIVLVVIESGEKSLEGELTWLVIRKK